MVSEAWLPSDLSRPKNWIFSPATKKRFDVYATATGLADKDDAVQASTFLHLVGSAAHEVSYTFTFNAEGDRKKLEKLKEKFEAYRVPKKNITMERHALLTRRQRAGEPLILTISSRT